MLRRLESIISYIVEINWGNHNCYLRNDSVQTPTLFMEIPVDKEEIEVPAFALEDVYIKKKGCPCLDKVVAFSSNQHIVSEYSSTDAIVRNVFNEFFSTSGLVAMRIKDKDQVITFFGTYGAFFYPDGTPMIMFTWKVKYDITDFGNSFQLIRPLLRINPRVYKKENPLERYIINKIIPMCLYKNFRINITFDGNNRCRELESNSPLVLFETPPFKIRKIKAPSMETENQELLDIAYDYFDDIKI